MSATDVEVPREILSDLEEHLAELRESLDQRVDALREAAAEAFSTIDGSDLLDEASLSAEPDGETALVLVERTSRRLLDVELALARVARGTYGSCQQCGSAMSLERLRALPAAATRFACSANSSVRSKRDLPMAAETRMRKEPS